MLLVFEDKMRDEDGISMCFNFGWLGLKMGWGDIKLKEHNFFNFFLGLPGGNTVATFQIEIICATLRKRLITFVRYSKSVSFRFFKSVKLGISELNARLIKSHFHTEMLFLSKNSGE